MANNYLNQDENILIKVDDNNLIYIDPNSVVKDKKVQTRHTEPENMVVYVNLEADIIPRTMLAADGDQNKQGSVTSIAEGNINFMRNQSGKDFDTDWTEAFISKQETTAPVKDSSGVIKTDANGKPIMEGTGFFKQTDATAQSFGIESIYMTTKGYTVPTVTINFLDVRGKTLFESGPNSPYRAFFHIPWPIFYLTVKGYYGKAIRYRLHLTNFTSKYNESNGNFEITCTFIGSTYAFLADLPLAGALNAPFMFYIEKNVTTSTNNNTTTQKVTVSKSSKGYQLLDSIYAQYKNKGYLDKNFKTRTLREVITIAKSLNEILEKRIFKETANMKIFVGLDEFEKKVQDFENAINGWSAMHLSQQVTKIGNDEYQYLNKTENNSLKFINSDDSGSLSSIIKQYAELLKNNAIFTQGLINTTGVDFKKNTFNYINNVGTYESYQTQDSNGSIVVNIKGILRKIYDIQKNFTQQKNKFIDKIQDEINKIIKNPKIGLGFAPTIRNIFAIILANMEVYIKLLQEVHRKAFDAGPSRKKLLKNYSDETPNDDNIYPWPLVKKKSAVEAQKIMAYPGDADLIDKLGARNPKLWPEVDFCENYDLIASKKLDTLANRESGIGMINFIFEDNESDVKILPISNILSLGSQIPYLDKSVSSVLYEIYERAIHATFYDNLPLDDIFLIEFNNIKESFNEDLEIIEILNKIGTTPNDLQNYLYSYSKNDKYPYFIDGLPTTDYIQNYTGLPFDINTASDNTSKSDMSSKYPKLNEYLKNYVVDDYRHYVYPFNSPTYLSYQHVDKVKLDNYKFINLFGIDTSQGFIKSPKDSLKWYKDGFVTTLNSTDNNIFNQYIIVNSTTHINLLNTPYFQKQLFNDFSNTKKYGKYKSSAYLLLNSLPFKDLIDEINLGTGNITMSSLFKEVGSTHYVPYHLMLKWGSIYHRYKTYLLDGVDILEDVTTPITGVTYFDINGQSPVYSVNGVSITYDSTYKNIGFQPFLEGVFYQIVNDTSAHFNLNNPGDYTDKLANKYIYTKEELDNSGNGTHYWTTFVDTSKYDPTLNYYTLLPTSGNNTRRGINKNTQQEQQNSFRIIWTDNDSIYSTFSGVSFTNYNEYFVDKDTDNYSLDGTKRKIIDLIGTFGPTLLNQFERYFLEFCTERENVEIETKSFPDVVTTDKTYTVSYQNFQDLLQDIVTVDKKTTDPDTYNGLIQLIRDGQKTKLNRITNKIISQDNLIKLTLANPKEYDYHLFNAYAKPNVGNVLVTNPFDIIEAETNLNLVKLYLGDDNDTTLNQYVDFFRINNIELNEENILQLRPLIYLWCGGYETVFNTTDEFKQYIIRNILLGAANRMGNFLGGVLSKLNGSELEGEKNIPRVTQQFGYNTNPMKVELYSYFKSFNDKWIGGNSLGQRSLMDEFLFLDRANRDIGDKAYLSLEKLIAFEDPNNEKVDLLGALAMLIQDTGFNMLGMPAYVNFYGTDFSKTGKIAPSRKIAKDLFGTYLEVDYQESTPKIIIQYTGPTSKYMSMDEIDKKYLFKDDTFNFMDQTRNPLRVTVPDVFDPKQLNNSNRVVGFEVNIGDQYQSMFKGVTLDQASLKNTTESFNVLENLGRSETGAATTELDVGLFDLYRTNSYTCNVSAIGNVMIQPTMYFYLKNIPLFRGTYWITEVTHTVKPNNLTTTFKGVRISSMALPDPKDSFITSYRVFFDAITIKAVAQQKTDTATTTPTTQQTITTSTGAATVDQGKSANKVNGEVLVNETGINVYYGIPYNGYGGEKYIQKVTYNNTVYYKMTAVLMGGPNYVISDKVEMSLFNKLTNFNLTDTSISKKLTWGDVKNINKTNDFYSLRFLLNDNTLDKNVLNNIFGSTTKILNSQNLDLNVNITAINSEVTTYKLVSGPLNQGPADSSYGIGLSESLMKKLGLKDGDPIYFTIS